MNYDITTKEGMANSVAWTENLFNSMTDGAVWGIPRSGMRVTLYPSKKKVAISEGFLLDDSIKQVIKAMGWTVTIL
jgi:hypothetical protein